MDVVEQVEKVHEKVMKIEKDTIAELVKLGVPDKLAHRLVTDMAKKVMGETIGKEKL